MSIKVISKNRRAFHEYEVGDRFEAGISLCGTEVKALRAAKVNLEEGWIDISDHHQAFLKDVRIGHYDFGNRNNHDENRTRRLLLHKAEILKLERMIREKGYTIVPLMVYFRQSTIKLEIALAKGKQLHDKREASKKRDAKKEISRALKNSKR